MKILVELPEWQYKEIKGNKGISEGVMINALCAIRLGEPLEQEPVIDKIRAEIEMEKLEDSPNFCIKAHNNAVDRVLQIIDKYKAESEADSGNDD